MGLLCVAFGIGWATTPIVNRQLSTLDNSKGTEPDGSIVSYTVSQIVLFFEEAEGCVYRGLSNLGSSKGIGNDVIGLQMVQATGWFG